tara:strand:+ start:2332 stop:2835 length:504 start_codon:yes stop_codon:yes gene_type:complete
MNNKTIIFGVAGFAIVGVGIYLLTRKPGSTTTTQTTNNGGGDLSDPSTAVDDSLGSYVGDILTTLMSNNQNNNGNNNGTDNQSETTNCEAPSNPFLADNVASLGLHSSNIQKMQNWFLQQGGDVAGFVSSTGGADGIIGSGFKSAYNLSRKQCDITGIADLQTKSGI